MLLVMRAFEREVEAARAAVAQGEGHGGGGAEHERRLRPLRRVEFEHACRQIDRGFEACLPSPTSSLRTPSP